ncbi:MAG: hypothetical protein RBR42_08615 [Desulfomicrobium sp.]|nr:hypothetical protein [Desulfomicrobium sp.]
MAKQTQKDMALAEVEAKAQEFFNLSLKYCEEETWRNMLPHPHSVQPRETALSIAVVSVHESIKTFLAIARIESE